MSAKLHIGLRAGSLGLAAMAGAALADFGERRRLLCRQVDRPADRGAARRRLRHLWPRGRHATSAGTFPAIRTSYRRTCRVPAVRAPPASSARSRPRTAPSSPISCRARSSVPCSIRRWKCCSIPPRSSISATSTTACASAFLERTPRSRRSKTRSSPTARPSAASPPTIQRATTATCTTRRRARITRWSPAIRAQPIFRWRSSAARSTACAGLTVRA